MKQPDASNTDNGLHPVVEVAGLGARLAARAIDTIITGAASSASFVIALLGASRMLEDFFNATWGEFGVALLLILLLPVLPMIALEVRLTARRGQTIGKGLCGVRVVRYDDGQVPSAADSFLRWIVPALGGIVGVIATAAVVSETPSDAVLMLLAGGFVSWLLVFASSLLGVNGRGWHDKAAGTIVVRSTPEVLDRLAAPGPAPREPGPKDRPATGDDPPRHSSYVQYWDEYLAGRDNPRQRPEADEPDRLP